MSCRPRFPKAKVVGDKSAVYPSADVTIPPLAVRTTDDVNKTDLMLQLMLTSSAVVKNKAKKGPQTNYLPGHFGCG